MKAHKDSMRIAGVDVDKHRLHVALHLSEEAREFDNTVAGIELLLAWLLERGVSRVGMEATGGYERALRLAVSGAGLEAVVHQPMEVRQFAKFKRLKAKNDRIDARLIGLATAQSESLRAVVDPRLIELGDRLTAYEHVSEQLASAKAFMEHVKIDVVAESFRAMIAQLAKLKAKLLAEALAMVRSHPDLAIRLKLLQSLPGVGPVVAVSLVARMPELGSLSRGQAASLLGVAPFDRDSGKSKGARFIGGGRRRPRRLAYLAALAARRCAPDFRAFAKRMADRGKPPKVALVAIMRKLIEAANIVLHRGQPWIIAKA
jgi:transposase